MSVFWESLPFSQTELAAHLLVFLLNLLLLFFSKSLVSLFKNGGDNDFQLTLFRTLNIFFLLFPLLDLTLITLHRDYQHIFARLAWSLVTVYIGVLLFNFLSFLSRKKFGLEKELEEEITYIETYNSRLVDLIVLIAISIFSLYILIDIWGFDSLLQTTGIFGIIAAFLALTNQIWAPDMFYGMVILNSKMLEDGDVIQVGEEKDEYIINKVTFIYTILLDVRNNHRTMIKNSKLVDAKIDNLSKKASPDGLRMKLSYKIGYPKGEAIESFGKKVDEMFVLANAAALEAEEIKVHKKVPFEWYLNETGDFALHYELYYYLQPLPNTKVTRTVRSYLLKTPKLLNGEVYKASLQKGIDLSTPILHQGV